MKNRDENRIKKKMQFIENMYGLSFLLYMLWVFLLWLQLSLMLFFDSTDVPCQTPNVLALQ